jgi:cytochrome c oxidase assembly protein subunit 15
MWTVTLKLLPVVVMAHLLGGILLLSLLFCLWNMQKSSHTQTLVSPFTRYLALAALIMVGLQIALGGWTSTNYAALSCPDFPLCQNQLWPNMSWQAFNLTGAAALDNPLNYMSLEARTAIHMMHRIGALITSILIISLAFALWKRRKPYIILIVGLLTLQIGLGITNVLALLPLKVAVAHNGVATLLLLSLISLQFHLRVKT